MLLGLDHHLKIFVKLDLQQSQYTIVSKQIYCVVPKTASNEICHRETRPPLSDSAAEEPSEACDSVLCRSDCELGFFASGALSNSVEKDNFEKSEFPDFGDFKMSDEARR